MKFKFVIKKTLPMPLTNLKITDLLEKNEKLTFLIGAGCSMDSPSSLSDGAKMMRAILKFLCEESEVENLLKIKSLRFEKLVEIVQNYVDPNLKIIDYYSQCDRPNMQHYYIAQMIKKGHFAITTNFDFLIEHALLKSKVKKKNVIPVITRNDFMTHNDPHELFNQGKMLVCKIHGSTRNIITDEITRKSLVTTIKAFGSNKEGLNVFQIEPFKREVFLNLTRGRTLVVLGYSGTDDFDIVPTIKVLKELQNLIWINYVRDDGGSETIYEIDRNILVDISTKVDEILVDIKHRGNIKHVYRVDVNTSDLIERLIENKPRIKKVEIDTDPMSWLSNNISPPREEYKIGIPISIYINSGKYKKAKECAKKLLDLANQRDDQRLKAMAFSFLGDLYIGKNKLSKAKSNFEEALKINEDLYDLKERSVYLKQVARIYNIEKNNIEALKLLEEALQIAELYNNLGGKQRYLTDIGKLYQDEKKYVLAIEFFNKALKITDQTGNLSSKSEVLYELGKTHLILENFDSAIVELEEAYRIAYNLGDISLEGELLNHIAIINFKNKKYSIALKLLEKAIDSLSKGDILENKMAEVIQGNYEYIKIISNGIDDSLAFNIFEALEKSFGDLKSLREKKRNL